MLSRCSVLVAVPSVTTVFIPPSKVGCGLTIRLRLNKLYVLINASEQWWVSLTNTDSAFFLRAGDHATECLAFSATFRAHTHSWLYCTGSGNALTRYKAKWRNRWKFRLNDFNLASGKRSIFYIISRLSRATLNGDYPLYPYQLHPLTTPREMLRSISTVYRLLKWTLRFARSCLNTWLNSNIYATLMVLFLPVAKCYSLAWGEERRVVLPRVLRIPSISMIARQVVAWNLAITTIRLYPVAYCACSVAAFRGASIRDNVGISSICCI